MASEPLLDTFSDDAGADIVLKFAVDQRAVGRDDQKAALSGDVADAFDFVGHD